MSKKTFNPTDWQPTETNKIESQKSHNSDALSPSPLGEGSGVRYDIEEITRRIESASVIIGEYDPILRGEKCWVDQKNKFWTDTMFLFFYVGDAGAVS